MTHGFQQQHGVSGFTVPKSAPLPQHGQKAGLADGKPKVHRSFQPKPGR